MSRISVIISTYRRDESLKTAVASVRAQTYPDVEILIADDNADPAWNERVARVAAEYGARHIVNPENLGSARNRNHAASLATGEYLAFLDDDDRYRPDKLARQHACICENGADMCIEDLTLVNEDGRFIETRSRRYLINARPRDYMKLHVLYHMTSPDTLMFRKSYFEAFGGFAPIDLGDDFYLMERAIERGGTLCYHPYAGTVAVVHSRESGLSSGENKLKCENDEFPYLSKFRPLFTAAEWRSVRARHYAVVSFAYLRMKKYVPCLLNAARAFFLSPRMCVKLIVDAKGGGRR